MHPEVLQHVKDGLEPEVLHSALAVLIQGQTEVLMGAEQAIKLMTSLRTGCQSFVCHFLFQVTGSWAAVLEQMCGGPAHSLWPCPGS